MQALHPAGPIIGSLVALGSLAWSLRQRRRHRLLADLPTSKVRGVFIGLVELNGTAESENPLTSFLAEKRCVDHRWTVEEHWRRTTTESYTDSKGNRRTRTKTSTGWETVARGGDGQPFYLQDDTGVVLVLPVGASIDRAPMFDATVSRGDPLYHGKGPDGSVRGSTGRRRFREEGIPLHAALYIVGDARERPDVVAPRIADADDAEFIISTRGEERVRSGLAMGSWALWTLGLIAAPLGLFIAAQASDFPPPPDVPLRLSLVAVAAYLALWGAGWAWMAHDSIIGLRERVRQAWSLVDVQLKRRHDLFPTLQSAVAALATHEREVQTALAAIRAQ
ncbi:MAG: LemA family protein, partial [Burkholderiales bacterium]|nr:LemA family protein [Opitutaceae bacterium]